MEFYHMLRQVSLVVISQHLKDLKETQSSTTLSDENAKDVEIGREIQLLSMKLATVNPRLDSNIEGLLSKDLLRFPGVSSSSIGFSPDMMHPQLQLSQPGWWQRSASGVANPDVFRSAADIGFSPDMMHPQLQLSQPGWWQRSAAGMANPDVFRSAAGIGFSPEMMHPQLQLSQPGLWQRSAAGVANPDVKDGSQEIYDKLEESSIPKGFCTDEHPSRDVAITELLNSIKEEHMKDFEQEYHLTEKIAQATEDVSVAVELYKHSVSILHTLERASKEERAHYVSAWYNMLQSCAQEMMHGAALWQESCHTDVCNQVISEGGHRFIALGEIYRVAQILYLSLQYFKPWVLADPGMLSKMLASLESCSKAWTCGLQTALTLVAESTRLDAPVAKALMESIKNINEHEVSDVQNFIANNEMACRLTLLPASVVQGMKVIMWNGDQYFVKVANLWANRISSDPPKLSQTPVPLTNNATALAHHDE